MATKEEEKQLGEDDRIVRQLLLDFVPTNALGDALDRLDRLTKGAKQALVVRATLAADSCVEQSRESY